MAYTRSYLETLPREQLRKLVQDADLGGSWTASAGKADLIDSLLAGERCYRGTRVARDGQPLGVVEGEGVGASTATHAAATVAASAAPVATGGASPSAAAEQVAAALAQMIASAQLSAPLDEAAVRRIVADEVSHLDLSASITVNVPERPEPRILEGLAHAALPDVVEAVALTGKALLLGPAGCGKTTLAKQVAAALDRPFFFLSCTGGTSEAQLMGRLLLDGSFLGTPLLDAIENGGLCLLDEADALDPNVTLALNAGVANGAFSVPNRPLSPVAKKHPNFALMLAANDVTGGSHLYSGRNQQDAALLDRFAAVTFVMQPDRALERAIAKGYGRDAEWLAPLLAKLRSNVEEHRVRRVVSMRLIEHAGALILANPERWANQREAIVERVLAGWSEEEKAKALDGVVIDAL
jgi:MoxR-like ATPase